MFNDFVDSHFNAKPVDGGVIGNTGTKWSDGPLSGGNFLSRFFGTIRSSVKRVPRHPFKYTAEKPLLWVNQKQSRKKAFGKARDDIHEFFRTNFTKRYQYPNTVESQVMDDLDLAVSLLDKINEVMKKRAKIIHKRFEEVKKALKDEPKPLVAFKWAELNSPTFDMMLSSRTPTPVDASIVNLLAEMEIFDTCREEILNVCRNGDKSCIIKQVEQCIAKATHKSTALNASNRELAFEV
jgi:hypothetical protein